MVRSTKLWFYSGASGAQQNSPVVPAGHVWVCKDARGINNSGGSLSDFALGCVDVSGNQLALVEGLGVSNAATIAFSGFVVLAAGDKLFVKTSTASLVRAWFSGADLLLL